MCALCKDNSMATVNMGYLKLKFVLFSSRFIGLST